MDLKSQCAKCKENVPVLEIECPHCGTTFASPPNVRIAQCKVQRDALQVRYDAAVEYVRDNSLDSVRTEFEAKVQAESRAVLSLGYVELRYIVDNERRVFATFYERIEAGLQIPSGGKWDVLRGITEHALYQHQKKHVRFAALSLDEFGVHNYGDCHVTLKTSMIEDRTSTFEDNNVVFTVYTQGTVMKDAINLPAGHISDWDNRHLLAVAKLTPSLASCVAKGSDFSGFLIDQGATTADDRFIELHIWGKMSVKTIENVVVIQKKVGGRKRPNRGEISSLQDALEKFGLKLVGK